VSEQRDTRLLANLDNVKPATFYYSVHKFRYSNGCRAPGCVCVMAFREETDVLIVGLRRLTKTDMFGLVFTRTHSIVDVMCYWVPGHGYVPGQKMRNVIGRDIEVVKVTRIVQTADSTMSQYTDQVASNFITPR
jgi:hypothetical protein